jgi:hypothetical protein
VATDSAGRVAVAQVQAGPEQLGHSAREADCSPRRRRRQLVGALQQVVEALLVPGVLEQVVWRPAVVDHGAAVLATQDGVSHRAAAGRVDDISGGLRPDQRV